MVKNGYFTVTVKPEGTFCTIFPPDKGGKDVTAEDIMAFLDEKKFFDYQVADIAQQLKTTEQNKEIKISSVAMNHSAAFCLYKATEDKMCMTAVMYPPVGDGTEMTVQEIMGDLHAKEVSFGIDEEAINSVVENRIYNTPFVIANGENPVQGKDAVIQYLFNTEHIAKPKMNDDGTVDFHDLDLISKVGAGQTVARIIPEVKGVSGHNIFGTEIAANRVSRKNFKYGKNLCISEDGLELISKVSGHVSLENDKVFVSNTYEVMVDLDNTTGDIDFDGNVVVRGNIRAGFSLKATGNVTVFGVVEGAHIEAGGDVTLNRGVQGMNKAEIWAKGNIVAKFIENAKIVCDGNLETDTLLHSSSSVGGTISASGKNGMIIGGTARSRMNVTAKQIGNEMGTATNVYVGVDPSLRKRVNELETTLKKSAADKEKLNQVIAVLRKKMEREGTLDEEKQDMLQKSMKNLVLLEQSIRKDKAEFKEGQEKLTENEDVRIKISRSIYPGTKLSFGNTVFYIKDRNDYCQYMKQGADVVRLPL